MPESRRTILTVLTPPIDKGRRQKAAHEPEIAVDYAYARAFDDYAHERPTRRIRRNKHRGVTTMTVAFAHTTVANYL